MAKFPVDAPKAKVIKADEFLNSYEEARTDNAAEIRCSPLRICSGACER